MLFPVRCFTCGKPLGNYERYENMVLELSKEHPRQTAEGIALDTLGMRRFCCRRMFLGHNPKILRLSMLYSTDDSSESVCSDSSVAASSS